MHNSSILVHEIVAASGHDTQAAVLGGVVVYCQQRQRRGQDCTTGNGEGGRTWAVQRGTAREGPYGSGGTTGEGEGGAVANRTTRNGEGGAIVSRTTRNGKGVDVRTRRDDG